MALTKWELKSHSYQIADTGDYDGHYEITNGKISIFTQDFSDDDFKGIIDALNNTEADFYLDDSAQFCAHHFEQEFKRELERSQGLVAFLKKMHDDPQTWLNEIQWQELRKVLTEYNTPSK